MRLILAIVKSKNLLNPKNICGSTEFKPFLHTKKKSVNWLLLKEDNGVLTYSLDYTYILVKLTTLGNFREW